MHKALTPKEIEDDPDWKAAYHLSFNRRGTYLAVGHATGTVAVHDFISRTTSAVYSTDATNDAFCHKGEGEQQPPPLAFPNGATSVTWSRRSRTLLAGGVGDSTVRLVDCTHPFGPDTASALGAELKREEENIPSNKPDKKPKEKDTDPALATPDLAKSLFLPTDTHPAHYQRVPRYLGTTPVVTSQTCPPVSLLIPIEKHEKSLRRIKEKELSAKTTIPMRFPILAFSLPDVLAGSLQIHPKNTTAGLAILQDGSLVLFRAPPTAWELYKDVDGVSTVRVAPVLQAGTDDSTKFTCAAWSHMGDAVFCCTKSGDVLGLDVGDFMLYLGSTSKFVPPVQPTFRLSMGAMAWHMLVSRNGKHLLLNCADGALRLYPTDDLGVVEELKPKLFQDVVSKEPFVCCDFSGDAEYLVGGCNGQNEKYELYLWNTSTGALMDRLTGAQVQLYSVAWHPTRSFLAVATSDGLVDIWGPRMDWTAFAPDFQALPMNVEYVEREDEFDLVEEQEGDAEEKELEDFVDVVTVDPVPVFASDSESESEVFAFDTKIHQVMLINRGRPPARSDKTGIDDKD
jgi:WD40 repeat protein